MGPTPSRRCTGQQTGRAVLAALLAMAALAGVELLARALASRHEPAMAGKLWIPRAAAGASGDHRDNGASIDPSTLVPDRRLLWTNRPSLARTAPVVPARPGQAPQWTLRTNSSGFRGAERSVRDAGEGVYRILCIGDSVTLGFNVDEGGDYPSVLARLLAERYPDASFDVVNAGVPEWSWVQGAEFLIRDGLALGPDLVVAAHGSADQAPASVTDSERIWIDEQFARRSEPTSGQLAPTSVAWTMLVNRLWPPLPVATGHSDSPGCRLQEAAGSTCRRVSLAEIELTVQRIGAATKAAGVDLLLMNLDFSGTSAAEAAHRAAIRDDLRFLDHAAHVKAERLRSEMVRSRDAGLALPKVPMVAFGRIGPPLPQGRGAQMRFRVTQPASARDVRVRGSGPEESGFRFDAQLHDDGTQGDEKAGDGVFSAIVEVPPTVSSLRYRFFADGVAEFEAPSDVVESNTDRTIRFNRDSDAPIERFGERYLMSDDIHPDAQGQRRVAEAVLAEIENMPAFRRRHPPRAESNADPGEGR